MNRPISSLEYRCKILAIALLSGVVALPLIGCQNAGAQTPSVTKGRASLIRFPKPWVDSEQGEEDTVLHPRWYEVRPAADSSGRELLFAGMTDEGYTGEVYSERPKESWYSLNFYAVGLGEKPRVRAASKGEWDRAAKVSGRPKKLFPILQEDLKAQSFEYGGRKYTKSSDNWGAVLLSPGGRWLAVFSYSGRKTQGRSGAAANRDRATSTGMSMTRRRGRPFYRGTRGRCQTRPCSAKEPCGRAKSIWSCPLT